jgi:hypothetical protein
MKRNDMKFLLAILPILGTLIFSACKASTLEATSTLSVEAVQTSAVSTFVAGLTEVALALPTNTPTNTSTETATSTPTRGAPTATESPRLPTVSCYGLIYISDVTIPDNTPMVPGQTFTKTWLVRNMGSCNWDEGFEFASTGGNAMSGIAFVLESAVTPGEDIEISIDMTAPDGIGTVRGNWRMSTTTGTFFGEELFVIIDLGNATPTHTPSPTP